MIDNICKTLKHQQMYLRTLTISQAVVFVLFLLINLINHQLNKLVFISLLMLIGIVALWAVVVLLLALFTVVCNHRSKRNDRSKTMTYNLYYINENNQIEHLISDTNKSTIINAILDCATEELEGDFYRLEMIFSPYSGTYLLIDVMHKSTSVIAEWYFIDDILDGLIEIMQKLYSLRFIVEEVAIDESRTINS